MFEISPQAEIRVLLLKCRSGGSIYDTLGWKCAVMRRCCSTPAREAEAFADAH